MFLLGSRSYPITLLPFLLILASAIAGCESLFPGTSETLNTETPVANSTPANPTPPTELPQAGNPINPPTLKECQSLSELTAQSSPLPIKLSSNPVSDFQRVGTWKHSNWQSSNPRSIGASVTKLAFSPQGTLIASSSRDLLNYEPGAQQIKMRLKQTGQEVCTLSGIMGDFPFSSDGQQLVTSDGKSIFLWDISTGNLQQTIENVGPDSVAPSLSLDGQYIVSPLKKQLKVWQTQTGELKHTLDSHTQSVESIAFHPTQPWLVSGSYDGTIKIWHLDTGELLRTLDARSTVWSVAVSSDEQWLASGHRDKTVRIWDIQQQKLHRTLTGHSDYVRSVAISPDTQLLASGEHSEIKVWDLQAGEVLKTLNNSSTSEGGTCAGDLFALRFSPDGDTLISSNCQFINVWHLKR